MSKPKKDLPAGSRVKISEVPDVILKQLLTPSEMRMLKNRFQILNLLEDGLSIRNIARQVKVGTDTVVRVARMIERGNLNKVLRMERFSTRKIRSSTPWIFGKSS